MKAIAFGTQGEQISTKKKASFNTKVPRTKISIKSYTIFPN